MYGFATGTVAEGIVVSLLGVGVVTKTATVIKGVLATAKTGKHSLSVLSDLRKSTNKGTHMMLRMAKDQRGTVRIGAIGKYLEKTDAPSGTKKLSEALDDADGFLDKPLLAERHYDRLKDNWPGLDEARLAARYQKAQHSMAQMIDIMGDDLTDDALEGFSLLQKKLFKDGVDDADRWLDGKALWKDLDTPAKRQSFNKSLEDYKVAAQADPDAKFWMKDIDTWQTKGYRYVTQAEVDAIDLNGGKLPLHHSREGQYMTFTGHYGNGQAAKSFLQLPADASEYVGRIEFDISDVKNNLRAAFSDNDNDKALLEFLAVDNSDFGTPGKGLQLLIDGVEPQVTFKAFGQF